MIKKLSLLLAAILLLTAFAGCEKEPERDTSGFAMYSQNFEVTENMIKYYFNMSYSSFVSLYSDNLDDIGLDVSEPLSEQECPIAPDKASWYDYFMDSAKEKLSQLLAIKEQANKDEKELSSEDKKAVEENISLIKKSANAENAELKDYITASFGKGVTLADIKACLELEQLGTRYFEDFKSGLKLGEEDIEDYFEGHKKLYSTADYLLFETVSEGDDMMAMMNAKTAAEKISKAKSPEDFKDKIEEYIISYYEKNFPNIYSKKEVKKIAKQAREDCLVENASYNSSDAASNWIFDLSRMAGESFIIDDEENGKCYIYYIVSPMHRADYVLPNVRNILFSLEDYVSYDDAKLKADEALNALKEDEFSAESFEEWAELSGDIVGEEKDCLYEELFKNTFAYQELDEWIFAENREIGESTLLKTELGWHLLYIESYSVPAWQRQARDGLYNSRFSDYVSDLCDEYVVHINSNIIYSIDEVNLDDVTPAT